ncbi:uncharacterized protein LOC134438688 [Engraulis encrasicolus]|uniref:uncharacterized protein LOC134438688 n=1 Tax=Engraulis encrasicolus TaxID=184585 RepID=UPI002FD5FD61
MTGEYQLKLSKNSTSIFRVRNYETLTDSGLKERYRFVSATGTLTITSAQISDSGSYTIETYTTSGISTGKCTFQLIIAAPVTIPVVTHSCDDDLKATVTCSSSGSSPQYSWSLDGRPLNKADADFISTVRLKRNVVGELKCTVSNNVNSESKTHQLPNCHANIKTVASTPSVTTVHPPLTETTEKKGEAWDTLQSFLYVLLPCAAGLGLLNFVMVIAFVYMSTRERRSGPHKTEG